MGGPEIFRTRVPPFHATVGPAMGLMGRHVEISSPKPEDLPVEYRVLARWDASVSTCSIPQGSAFVGVSFP